MVYGNRKEGAMNTNHLKMIFGIVLFSCLLSPIASAWQTPPKLQVAQQPGTVTVKSSGFGSDTRVVE